MGVTRRFLRSLCFAAALATGIPVAAQTPESVKPRIVLQSTIAGIEVAAWLPGDRFLVAGLGTGRILTIWDTTSGIIVDKVRLPADTGASGGDYIRLTGIDIAPDGRTAMVHGIGLDLTVTDGAKSIEYRVDLAARTAAMVAPRPLPPGTKGATALVERISALEVLFDEGKAMTPAAAEKLLPVLPHSHDRRFALRRVKEGLQILDRARIVRTLTAKEIVGYSDAALSSDGRRLAVIGREEQSISGSSTTVEWFDLTTAAPVSSAVLKGNYGEVRWIDADHVAVSYETDGDERDPDDSGNAGAPPPVLILAAATGKIERTIPARCYVRPLPGGGFVGAGLAQCRAKVGSDRALQAHDPATGIWKAIPAALPALLAIDNLTVSPDGATLVATVRGTDDKPGVVVVERKTGRIIDSLSFAAGGNIMKTYFAPDGVTLLIAANGGLQTWKPLDAASKPLGIIALTPQMMTDDGRTLLTSGAGDDAVVRVDLASGKRLPPLDFGNVVAGGYVSGKPLFWAASYFGGVRLWDTRNWSELLTSYHFAGGKYLAVTPEGVYDTNLGTEAQEFRWIVPDAPFQSLAPQTFMRDYFEPRLTQRKIDCTLAGTCDQVFAPLPPIAKLNRVLPKVEITGVRQGEKPTQAVVTVRIGEGVDATAANGKTRTGVYDVRLFRNGRLALQHPEAVYRAQRPGEERQPEAVAAAMRRDIGAWRKLNVIAEATDGRTGDLNFYVDLPTGATGVTSEFSAYAFNEDRVKSDTSRARYTRPAVEPEKPRAFIIAIGIDAYDAPQLQLRFAAGDASLIASRLADIPGYNVKRIELTGITLPDGKRRRVTSNAIEIVLSALAGGDPGVSAAALKDMGFDASALDTARPDDIVIFSYSGHGWADPQGNFYLLPTDTKWTPGSKVPDLASLMSSDNLSVYFTAIKAAEIAIIIDACHSGASVDAGGFKPGPMGDSGLGQLAFDKGIRILAASQAADVALEDAVLRQGLLTYALAGEGITSDGGKADADRDGRITLDEWLRYAVQRLPGLSEDVRVGRFGAPGTSASRDFDLLDATPAARPKPQEPALFDFNAQVSPVVLRDLRR